MRCGSQVEFENQIVGTAIPASYIASIEKGFREACNSGALIGYPVEVGTCNQGIASEGTGK